MPRPLVFATGNQYKLKEVKAILGTDFVLSDLVKIGCTEEVPETQNTIEGNAVQKANYVFDNYGLDCFAEDTGLEVMALDGEPGVFSARYAGPQRSAADNMNLVLERLQGKTNRKARFKTVIALVEDGKVVTFEGIINGVILNAPTGKEGFGYDPIFQPEGYDQSFAQIGSKLKNKISHRAIAVDKLVKYLQGSTG